MCCLTLITKSCILYTGMIPVPKKERSSLYLWEAPPPAHTVAGKLFLDLCTIPELEELRPHIMQHLYANWTYHICNKGDDMVVVKNFRHHFLCGLLHWNGDHYHCKNCEQLGFFPIENDVDINVNRAKTVYNFMFNTCKQMCNPASSVTSPFVCIYKIEYEQEPLVHFELPEIENLVRGTALPLYRECNCLRL